MTVNFSNFQKLKVDATLIVDLPLDMIEGDAVLKLAPATEANRSYYNALLKNSRSKMGAIAGKKVNADTVKRNRTEDRQLYAKYIVVGWSGIVDAEGVDVIFDKPTCKQFLDSLPDWIFDSVRIFAGDPQNFLTIDAEEVSGN